MINSITSDESDDVDDYNGRATLQGVIGESFFWLTSESTAGDLDSEGKMTLFVDYTMLLYML